jgi:hypothetical protein
MATTRRPSVDHFADSTSQRADYYELDERRQIDSATAPSLSRQTSGVTARPPSVGPLDDLGQTPAESMAADFRSSPSVKDARGSVYGAGAPPSRRLSHVREDTEDDASHIRDSRTIVGSNESLPHKEGFMASRKGDLGVHCILPLSHGFVLMAWCSEYSDPYMNQAPQTESKK